VSIDVTAPVMAPAHDLGRKRFDLFLLVLLFWLAMIGVESSSAASRGLDRIWPTGLTRAIVAWTVWALLVPFILKLDRLLPVRRDALFERFLFHIPLSLIFSAIKQLLAYTLFSYLRTGVHTHRPMLKVLQGSFGGAFQAGVFVYWIVVFSYFAFEYRKDLYQRELQALDLERRISESRLKTLRAQLRPNLLFYTLRAISARVESSPRIARRMLEEVGALLRLSLANSEEEEVPLAQEIGVLEHYLEIQKAEFEERLGAIVKADSDVLHALVPTFILQPLVQTAMLYGMSSDQNKRRVEVRAWRQNGQLYLRVEDNGARFSQGGDVDDAFGIGVANTRERLKCLYGDQDQTFKVVSEPGKGICVDLSIPFREGS
jgi:two-component system LytT family sensor kinase